MAFSRFVKEKVTGLSILTVLATYISVVVGLDYIYTSYWGSPNAAAIAWAGSLALGIYAFVGLLNYCWFAQTNMQDEIDRITAIKARLEAQVLKKRQSSKRHKK
jgi:hypothetical protein